MPLSCSFFLLFCSLWEFCTNLLNLVYLMHNDKMSLFDICIFSQNIWNMFLKCAIVYTFYHDIQVRFHIFSGCVDLMWFALKCYVFCKSMCYNVRFPIISNLQISKSGLIYSKVTIIVTANIKDAHNVNNPFINTYFIGALNFTFFANLSACREHNDSFYSHWQLKSMFCCNIKL